MDDPTHEALRELEALEAKLRQAVERMQTLRAERNAARGEPEKLRAALHYRAGTIRELESQLLDHETEREKVRGRIEQLLAQIDALEKKSSS